MPATSFLCAVLILAKHYENTLICFNRQCYLLPRCDVVWWDSALRNPEQWRYNGEKL